MYVNTIQRYASVFGRLSAKGTTFMLNRYQDLKVLGFLEMYISSCFLKSNSYGSLSEREEIALDPHLLARGWIVGGGISLT